MLLELTLKNFAVIDNLSINFEKGLNIITGETGTGKSIIVDGINIILGEKASTDFIKSGRDEAQIEAILDMSENKGLKDKLESSGFDVEDDELIVKRIISRKGRSRVFINGSAATFSILERIRDGLVDIFSQHEHQTLLREEKHLELLDEFGGLRDLALKVAELFRTRGKIKSGIEELQGNQRAQVEKEDFLRFQLREIEAANLQPGEDERLEEDRKKLANAEKLYSITQGAYDVMYEGERAVIDVLKKVQTEVEEAGKIDAALADVAKAVERGLVEIQDAAFALRDYALDVRFDPDGLNSVEGRLEEVKKLKRKYGGSIQEILQRRDKIEEELDEISNYEEKIEVLQKELEKVESELGRYAEELSRKRRKAASNLTSTVIKELKEVGIGNGKFVVDFEEKAISASGNEKAVFLFSANPDEKPRPLQKVASGGELSRIMLVLKQALAKVEGGSVIIFDEADSGIGGAVAETVGLKIKNLSKNYQVICITHLPQIAKFGDAHLRVAKTFEDDKTKVSVKALNGEEKVKELARMLGGIKVTEKTIEAAREMVKELEVRRQKSGVRM
ncbi:MAG TPA: DNA repair protein RecN [Thermodesulfobacteriota bacterium]|nr:DNA repair protein RecN [Thermodesulfobacteriota bacterium]